MSIKEWPAAERPREKLLERGAAALSDAELLAIFIRTGIAGRSAVDLARDLLTEHQGLRSFLDNAPERLIACRGLGPAKTGQLLAALELGKRYLEAGLLRQGTLSSPADTRTYLKARLRSYPYEVFAVIFLDNRHRVIAFEELFNGTIDGASVHPREVLRRALYHNAAALILAHNHPSGIAEPSAADKAITRRLQDALALVDVRVLDHFVIGDEDAISFADRGLL
ncbi:MAG: JAB domain-containing protein [Gammaproteobacteria bacterium]|nr:MAG: JAB domain-containing protein [Gammaproteobacteria bacterium]